MREALLGKRLGIPAALLALLVLTGAATAWVYVPSYGIPEEAGKYAPKSPDGGRITISCDVKNVGRTGATFVARLDYPGVTVRQGPGHVYIPAGETRTFSWVVSKPATASDYYVMYWTVEVTAIQSDESILIHGIQEWTGTLGAAPPVGHGSPWKIPAAVAAVVSVGAVLYYAYSRGKGGP